MVKRLCSLPVDSSGFRAHSSAVDPGHHCGPGGRALATSVTMSQIAEEAAIRDATLYKCFSDVEANLVAWQERRVTGYLEHLAEVRAHAVDAFERLEALLGAYGVPSWQ